MKPLSTMFDGSDLVIAVPESSLPEWPANFIEVEIEGRLWRGHRTIDPVMQPDGSVLLRYSVKPAG